MTDRLDRWADPPLLVLASGAERVDTARLSEQLGALVHRASPEFVRSRTGFAIGGVAPVGHLEPIRTLVDTDLSRYDVVWAAAGHPHAVFPTSFDELVATIKKLLPNLNVEILPGTKPVSRSQHLDTGRAREMLGWQPTFTMEQAFEDYIRDLRAQMGRN